MLVVMKKDCSTGQIDKVCEAIRGLGFDPHPMPGAARTVVCITGNQGAVPTERFAGLEGILDPIFSPAQCMNRAASARADSMVYRRHRPNGARRRHFSEHRVKTTCFSCLPVQNNPGRDASFFRTGSVRRSAREFGVSRVARVEKS